MFQSRTAKIALAVFLVIALIVVAYFLFYSKKDEGGEGTATKTAVSDDEYPAGGTLPTYSTTPARPATGGITGTATSPTSGQSPVATAIASPGVQETVTPYPGSGVFDWTRRPTESFPDNVTTTFTTEQVRQIKNNDICGLSGISNSWSDPFEKIVCDITEFTSFKIIEPLRQLACQFAVAALQLNYDQNIKLESSTEECKIIDR